jgi:hypothetical protein
MLFNASGGSVIMNKKKIKMPNIKPNIETNSLFNIFIPTQ